MTSADRPTGICFDYGRTLVDFARPVAAIAAAGATLAAELPLAGSSWTGTAGELGLALDRLVDQLVAEGQRADPWREVDIEVIHQEALHRLLGVRPSPELSASAGAALQRAWATGVVPIEPAREVLATLKERGFRLALCSNAPFPAQLMHQQLERLDLRRYLDAVLFSSEIGWRKPDPRIFAEMLRRFRLPAQAVWFLGDEWEADIEGARAAGMRAILAPGSRAPVAGAEQLAQWSDLLVLLS
ncbi:MAG TPA: HAD family hydrolase [Candidatus Dormibacteraeota bacterium]|nr:HAD family hydrolase [Candidatus Dormibacteraeota bacterium]